MTIGTKKSEQGFTLIELSIVLVIIGLIVGGVLVGQDLIRAAEIRATITQVEKFNTAVNTFRGKYGAIPGDMNLGVATNFGFLTTNRGTTSQGDGNGLLDGAGTGSTAGATMQAGGETGVFWTDLTYANGMNLNLVEGGFQTAAFASAPSVSNSGLALYFPAAKLGRGNYFYVYTMAGYNYYGLVGMNSATPVSAGVLTGNPAMSVLQAYTIDAKVDDGLPTTGSVQVNYIDGTSAANTISTPAQANAAATGSYTTSTCYDSTLGIYATGNTINGNGSAGLCALSFRFQ